MKQIGLVLACVLLGSAAWAAAPDTMWTRAYGAADDELAYAVEEASDSGFVVAGYTYSLGAGDADYYFVKFNPGGGVAWSGPHGGSERDEAYAICSAPDGGYLVAGFSNSYPPNGFDYHLVKLHAAGGELWDDDYGIVNLADYVVGMCRTVDDYYVMVGTRVPDTTDMYIVKVNALGIAQWEHNMDLPGIPSPHGVAATSDSGFVVVGDAGSRLYVGRHSKHGGRIWGDSWGSGSGRSVAQTADGGFIVLGTRSFPGKDDDFWLLRLNADGDSLWSRNYGNTDPELAFSLDITHDGGFVLAGQHYPPGQNLNMWVVRTDENGDSLWALSIGGSQGEFAYGVRQLADSSYVVVGRTASYGSGGDDVYVARIEPDPPVATAVEESDRVVPRQHELGRNYPNPFNAGTRIEYTLSETDRIRIVIYNALGQKVCTLRDGAEQVGTRSVHWNGRNSAGEDVASGVYFYRLESGSQAQVRSMVLLR